VMRARPGDALAVFNGRDGEWRATIARLGRGEAILSVEAELRPPTPENGPWLAFALLKRGPTDLVAQKATELGAARLLPLSTSHTQAERVKIERLQAIAVEAAEQCGRLTVPEVAAPAPLSSLASSWPPERSLLIADESGTGQTIADAAPALRGRAWGVLIGPEGGFATGELDALKRLPFVTAVGLGPRLLRAETAAIAALSVIQALAGDWRAAAGG